MQNYNNEHDRCVKENKVIRDELDSLKIAIVNNDLEIKKLLEKVKKLENANIILNEQSEVLKKKFNRNHIDSIKAQEIRSYSQHRNSPYTIGNAPEVSLVEDLKSALKNAKIIARKSR